jgi:hypothetical protein
MLEKYPLWAKLHKYSYITGFGPIALNFPFILEELTDKSTIENPFVIIRCVLQKPINSYGKPCGLACYEKYPNCTKYHSDPKIVKQKPPKKNPLIIDVSTNATLH